ncbi:MAG: hypothetical protein IKM61_04425 [Eubacteriaceae bacterium]|nr:hypothetical protein [Eubacteriaceae bacterium]
MKKITAAVLCIALLFSFASCGINGHEVKKLDIDLEKGSLGGLRLGMSVDEAKASGVFDADKLQIIYGEGVLPFDMAYVNSGEGITVLGEDSALEMFIIDGKLSAVTYDLNMDMTGKVSDFSEREEFFTGKAGLITSALKDSLGEPAFYNSGGIKGSVYPGDDDNEAIVQIVYFVKDGKLLSKDDLRGTGLSAHYAQTDFDFAIASMLTKSFIASEESLATRSDAGIITLQIASKQALQQTQSVIDSQLSDKQNK